MSNLDLFYLLASFKKFFFILDILKFGYDIYIDSGFGIYPVV